MWESRTFKKFPDVGTMQGRLRFLKGGTSKPARSGEHCIDKGPGDPETQ